MNTLTYTLWSEVHRGGSMPLDEVRSRFATHPLPEVLGVLQRMDFLLSRVERPDEALQDRIGIGLLGQKRWSELVQRAPRTDRPPGQRRPLFWHSSLVQNATKMALLVCPDSVGRPPGLSDLAEGILGLSDHLEPDWKDKSEQDRISVLRHYVTANSVFNEGVRFHSLVALGRRLYLTSHPELRRHPLWVDLPQLFRQATGLEPDRLLRIGVATWSFFLNQDADRIHEGTRVLNLHAYLASTAVDPREVDAFLRVVSRDVEEMRQEVGRLYSSGDLKPFSVTPFAETPLVRLGNLQFCLSFNLLVRRLSTDLHYFFVQFLPESERQAYFRFHGVAFEELVHNTLERASKRKKRQKWAPSVTRYSRVDSLELDPEQRRADGIIQRGATALVLDAKAGRLPSPVLAGDQDKLDEYLENTVLKGARQVDATIDRIRSGAIQLQQRPTRFIPVVVTLQYLGWNPVLAEWIARRIADEGLLLGDDVLPLQVAELESLLTLAETPGTQELDLVGLFERRATDAVLAGTSLQNAMITVGAGINWDAPSLRRDTRQIFDWAVAMLRPSDGSAS